MAIQSIEDNSMCVDIRDFDSARAFFVEHIPGPAFNRVKGLSTEAIPFLDHILDFFKEKEIPCRFELTPTHASSEVWISLTERGLRLGHNQDEQYWNMINSKLSK